jgi:hypothetical protein
VFAFNRSDRICLSVETLNQLRDVSFAGRLQDLCRRNPGRNREAQAVPDVQRVLAFDGPRQPRWRQLDGFRQPNSLPFELR